MKSRQSPGALTWKAALGEKLGGKLYGALSSQLTDEKLSGHAAKAVDAALAQVRKALEGQVKPSEEEAVQLFLAEIDKRITGLATEAVTASGLSQGIRDYADVHPYEIALAAIAGAVAYVMSNQDLPLLEAKLGLGGGHSLTGGIDPGRTMKLAVEQVRIGYRYQGDHVAAYLNADKFRDGRKKTRPGRSRPSRVRTPAATATTGCARCSSCRSKAEFPLSVVAERRKPGPSPSPMPLRPLATSPASGGGMGRRPSSSSPEPGARSPEPPQFQDSSPCRVPRLPGP